MEYKGNLFLNRKTELKKLLDYGFVEADDGFCYMQKIINESFLLKVTYKNDKYDIKTFDLETEEEYTLIHIPTAVGGFVGQIRDECTAVLEDICEKCTVEEIFKSDYAKAIIRYAKEKYSVEAEYLWKKFPNNAVLRLNNDTKWFAVILTMNKSKLGLNDNGSIEVIDLRAKPEDIEKLVDNKMYFPGYHMNKKHWYTICLDKSVNISEIYRRIDESYYLK